jgi:hypothetical protein
MKKLQTITAILLAIPMIVFGSNYFLKLFPLPEGDGSPGAQILDAMRAGGLMSLIAFSHVAAGVLLVVPRTRFLGALMQLTMTLGITSFHLTMNRAGLAMAIVLLLLNLGALADPTRLRDLVEPAWP